jgi:hypothetical protein
MTGPRRTRRTPTSKPRKPGRSSETIVRAAVAHEGQAVLGGKVKLTLRVTLSRAQAERLTARAISEGKNLDALVAEILEAAPTEPTA